MSLRHPVLGNLSTESVLNFHSKALNFHSKFRTGWRRLIGCLKLQFIFRKRATNYRALLRKMTYKDKASYDSMPPCSEIPCENFY